MAVDQRTTELTEMASIPANPANLLLYAVDLSEVAVADQSKKMALTLLDSRFATAAQGALAATALQNAALFATAAQGVKADSALQAAAIGVSVQAYDAGLAAITAFGRSLIAAADATAGRVIMVSAGTGVANTFALAQTMPQIRLTDTTEADLSSTNHAFQVGPTAGANLIIDPDEIQARSNGTAVQLRLNPGGGNVNLGTGISTGEQIRAIATTSVSLASQGNAFGTGSPASTNIVFDTTSIQARSNGAAVTLNLNPLGGTVKTNQASTTGAVPSLWLIQADLSEEFIRFQSTVGAGNAINTTALGAYYGRVRVYVEGVGAKWLALYD